MNTPHERLREARAKAGFENAKDAAISLGVKVSTYISHENGTRGIPVKTAPIYARRFKVTEEWLLYGKQATTAEYDDGEWRKAYLKLSPNRRQQALEIVKMLGEE